MPNLEAGAFRCARALPPVRNYATPSTTKLRLEREPTKASLAGSKLARQSLRAAQAPARPEPLVMLARGDSWFDYPLTGNSLPIDNTDVIAQLKTMGDINPVILNLSHHGDATTDEILPRSLRSERSHHRPLL
jgi:hypothetical protein